MFFSCKNLIAARLNKMAIGQHETENRLFFFFCNVSSIHKKKNDQQVIENLFPYLKNVIKARLKAIKNCEL